jgi:Bacterial PH domain
MVFRWLWKRSSKTKATIESGRVNFPPIQEIRMLAAFIAMTIAALLIWSSLPLQPSEWWLPCTCLALLVGVPFMIPPVLTIDVHGIVSRTWFGHQKIIRWENVASLHFNTGSKNFTVRDRDGRKIVHTAFHAGESLFSEKVRARTRQPMKVTDSGLRCTPWLLASL